MDSGLNTINPAAFAAEHAQVVQQIADLNARKQTIDPAQRTAIDALAHRLGFDGGVPREAAIVLAQRIVALESKLSQPVYDYVQRLEAKVLQLERDVATLRAPAHMKDVERRG